LLDAQELDARYASHRFTICTAMTNHFGGGSGIENSDKVLLAALLAIAGAAARASEGEFKWM